MVRFAPPRGPHRPQVREHMVSSVMSLWEMGFDTNRMAKVLQEREDDCERWLHIALARRRAAEPATGDL